MLRRGEGGECAVDGCPGRRGQGSPATVTGQPAEARPSTSGSRGGMLRAVGPGQHRASAREPAAARHVRAHACLRPARGDSPEKLGAAAAAAVASWHVGAGSALRGHQDATAPTGSEGPCTASTASLTCGASGSALALCVRDCEAPASALAPRSHPHHAESTHCTRAEWSKFPHPQASATHSSTNAPLSLRPA